MTSLRRVLPALAFLFFFVCGSDNLAYADSGHARIVRLSLVQGDVRFARDVKGDPLNDSQIAWESAALNLPIRQGYVVATDNGRAEIEFENGAMVFLAENTALQFYDLSSEDGGFTTRLILRQGSAEFSVNPARGDYFSVTGGDFSVQAETKVTFRMNNFDDGSNVAVLHGHLTVLTNGKNTEVAKGQELSMRAGQPDSTEVARAPEPDEFDQWVAGRIEGATAAANAALQYTNYSGYASGYGDLYTYGAWFPVAGYGYCWRPYGVGFGWSPFDYGSWYYDPFWGWTFLGGYSWGWLPYHYGGWLFQPGIGWVWVPAGTFGGGVGRWRPVSGVWMRSSSGTIGVVPSHPLDTHGKTPLNLAHGVFAVGAGGVSTQLAAESDARWKVEKQPGRDLMQSQLATASAPARVPRAMLATKGTTGPAGNAGTGSTIVYDRTEHKFVNSSDARSSAERSTAANSGVAASAQQQTRANPEQNRAANTEASVPPAPVRETPRQFIPAARATPAPPSVPRSVVNERAGSEFGGASRGTGSSTGSSSRGAVFSGGKASSGGGSRSSGTSGGGGRPH